MKLRTHPDGPEIDFSECEREPIRTPNHVQPHGALLVLDEEGLRVRQASLTVARFLGFSAPEAVGRSLAELAGAAIADRLRDALAALPAGDGRPASLVLDGVPRGGRSAATLHRVGPRVVLELEPLAETGFAAEGGRAGLLVERRLAELGNLYAVAHALAEATAAVTGYHRVMVYRFLPDWSGEVIAEIKRPEAQPFLGLRFPATDIPQTARALYASALVRTIFDVDAVPAPLHPPEDPPGAPALDMSWCVLRAAAPVHLQYLRNMGVTATLVASLMVEGRLWGLIACHHDTPFAIAPEIRQAMAEIAAAGARRLETISLIQAAAREQRLAVRLKALRAALPAGDGMLPALLFEEPGLLDATLADGGAVYCDGRILTVGQTPAMAEIGPVLRAVIDATPGEALIALESLEQVYPPARAFRDSACGVLALVLSRRPLLVLAAFRAELLREVVWGGDPRQPAVLDAAGRYLSPRSSFEQWRETLGGHCRAWEAEAVEGMRRLGVLLEPLLGDAAGAALPQLDRALQAAEGIATLGRALLTAVDTGVLIARRRAAEPDGTVLDLNRQLRWALGLNQEDVRGQPLEAVMRRIGAPPELAALPVGGRQDVVLVSEALGRRVFSVSRRALFKVKTDLLDASVSAWLFNDITRHRRVEEALRAAHDRAMVASRAKSDLLANMSHELRTPLNAVIGFAELMAAEAYGPLGSERYVSYLADIRKAGEHLLELIDAVLDLSRIEAGRMELEDGAVAVGEMVAEACQMLGEQCRRKGLALEARLPDDPPVIRGDRRAVSQILLNLLSNAVKFTPAGGRITVAAARLEDSRVLLEVADTGIGIPPEEQQRVFEPFHRVGPAYTVAVGGTGLGLALVKALAHLHGAELALSSTVGAGTAVRVIFPVARTLAASAAVHVWP